MKPYHRSGQRASLTWQQRKDQKRAKEEVEKLFLHFRTEAAHKEGTIIVNYVPWFPDGKGFVTITIPVARESLKTIAAAMMAFSGAHYPPAVINDSRKGPCLRLTREYKEVKSGEYCRLLKCATTLATWAENFFRMRAIVSQLHSGPIGARHSLGI